MLKNLKRMLVVIPCMIFGLFLVGSLNVSAAEWELVGATSTVEMGEGSKNERNYYFTSDTGWQINGELTGWQKIRTTFITYQVIKPDGSATEESDFINIIDSRGVFTISDISKLDYREKVDVNSRISIVPAATYYVDIRHYGGLFGSIPGDQRGEVETIKIVLGKDNPTSIPNVNVSLNKTTNEFTIDASSLVDEKAYSLIKKVEYYFSDTAIDNTTSTFVENMEASPLYKSLDFKKSSVTVTVDKPIEEYGYLYVMVTTYHNYTNIKVYDIENATDEQEDAGETGKNPLDNNNNDESGWPDFKLGEVILLVLVIVLIVSCVLIITQKIVDYKKRLY